jgi:hypothetical protein
MNVTRTIKFYVYNHTTEKQVDIPEACIALIKESAAGNITPGVTYQVTNGALYMSQVSLLNSSSGVRGSHWFDDVAHWANDVCEYVDHRALQGEGQYCLELKADVRR